MPVRPVKIQVRRAPETEWQRGGVAAAWLEELAGEWAFPAVPGHHREELEEAGGWLALDEEGREVAAFRASASGCLLEMAASRSTDTQKTVAAFRAFVRTGAARRARYRTDDPWLLPLVRSRAPVKSGVVIESVWVPDEAGPFHPAKSLAECSLAEALKLRDASDSTLVPFVVVTAPLAEAEEQLRHHRFRRVLQVYEQAFDSA